MVGRNAGAVGIDHFVSVSDMSGDAFSLGRTMEHRIAAGAIVVEDDRLLMVHCNEPELPAFWVPPGGGALIKEDIYQTAVREVREETGLDIELVKLAYVEQLFDRKHHHLKLWFHARVVGGELSIGHEEAKIEGITDVRFFSREELGERLVVPPFVQDILWDDHAKGFPTVRLFELREMLLG